MRVSACTRHQVVSQEESRSDQQPYSIISIMILIFSSLLLHIRIRGREDEKSSCGGQTSRNAAAAGLFSLVVAQTHSKDTGTGQEAEKEREETVL